VTAAWLLVFALLISGWIAGHIYRFIAGSYPLGTNIGWAVITFGLGGAVWRALGRNWETIRRLEPDAVPIFRKRHRVAAWAGGIAGGSILCAVISAGIVYGRTQVKTQALEELSDRISAVSFADLNRRVNEILQPVNTFEDFYRQRLAEEKVFDKVQVLATTQAELVSRFAEEGAGVAAYRVKIEQWQHICAENREWINAWRDEIHAAKLMMEVPSDDRREYYRTQVVPAVQRREDVSRRQEAEAQRWKDGE
jgi:hypothetical protein